jgi:hypothetical protein
MDQAIWLASIFGPIMAVMGLWILLRAREVERFWISMKATPAAFYLGAFLNVLIGFTILSLYSSFDMNLAIFVTLFGCVQVLRGALSFFFTEQVMKWTQMIMSSSKLRYFSLIPLAWSAVFIWLGYFV